jgi:Protein of unknown function (DUF4087)
MLRPILLTTALLAALPAQAETRCGWYNNPTPGNVILKDADGEWWLSMQGRPPAPGFEDAYTTDFDNRVRIDYAGQVTQRYGYSCACAEGQFDASRGQYDNVISIESLKEIPLSRCEQDAALPPP